MIGNCLLEKIPQSNEICGESGYSKVMSGATSVGECCNALQQVQDCYLVCSCDQECSELDKATACQTTGTNRDPVGFWQSVIEGLDKDGEGCAPNGDAPCDRR